MISQKTINFAIAVLRQQAFVIKQLDVASFSNMCPILHASVGQHVRHSLDHMSRVVQNLGCADANHVICYDKRTRGSAIEQNPKLASKAIQECITALENTSNTGLDNKQGAKREMVDKELQVEFMVSGSGEVEKFRTWLSREIQFASHHALHHNAMIKAISSVPFNGAWIAILRCFGFKSTSLILLL